ncbi:J domain-containing protein spf31 isoform X1 [Primulina eburnea]|uniref:J domain-containing protein spf31 isoform X1 n=1 Tax=Primulina eburnea TaxID=1245227 RepID=UPI003C6CC161
MGETATSAAAPTPDEDQLLKSFLAEVSEVERDNEVNRILSCFKLNSFEHLNLPFDSSPDDVKKQYRKLSLLVHPDKCKHPQAKEAFAALAKAQQLLHDPQEREYLLNQVNSAKEEIRAKRKKQLKKDTATKLKSLVDEGKYEQEYERSDEFQQQLKLKVRELLTDQEWRRRKMQIRISEEEGRLKKDEEETKELWKRKREHEEQWEGTRENRVSSWRDFMKGGKRARFLCFVLLQLRKASFDLQSSRQRIRINHMSKGRRNGEPRLLLSINQLYCWHKICEGIV